jgi:hsp70-interacting protein
MSAPNWFGLLKWSLAVSDGTSPSLARPMSDEDRMFLERVMKECVKDEPARISEIIESLIKMIEDNRVSASLTIISGYLDELDDIIDQIDMAQIFVKFGGLECLLKILEMNDFDSECKSHISSVIGALCQNNIIVQDEIFNKSILNRLVRVFLSSDNYPKLQTKVSIPFIFFIHFC